MIYLSVFQSSYQSIQSIYVSILYRRPRSRYSRSYLFISYNGPFWSGLSSKFWISQNKIDRLTQHYAINVLSNGYVSTVIINYYYVLIIIISSINYYYLVLLLLVVTIITYYQFYFFCFSCPGMRGRSVLLCDVQVQPDQLHPQPLQVRQGEGLHRRIGRTKLQ